MFTASYLFIQNAPISTINRPFSFAYSPFNTNHFFTENYIFISSKKLEFIGFLTI